MDKWEIDKKVFFNTEELNMTQYLILYLLYNEEYKDLEEFMNRECMMESGFSYSELDNLMYNNYIRLSSNKKLDEIIITSKTKALFEVKKTEIEEIIDTLNFHSNSKYRSTSKSSIRLLNARLKEYSKQEIQSTIKYMCGKWINSSMEHYLRPETLFNETKFQSYYNEWSKINKTKWKSQMK